MVNRTHRTNRSILRPQNGMALCSHWAMNGDTNGSSGSEAVLDNAHDLCMTAMNHIRTYPLSTSQHLDPSIPRVTMHSDTQYASWWYKDVTYF